LDVFGAYDLAVPPSIADYGTAITQN